MSNCDSCDAMYIQGLLCHELGCPAQRLEEQKLRYEEEEEELDAWNHEEQFEDCDK